MITTRFLEPDEYHLIDHFFDNEGAPRLDPNFSKVIASFDGDVVVGIMCLQMVLHIEPIIIDPAYRGQHLWKDMAEMADGYLIASGAVGAYAQPLHESTKHMCREAGFTEMPHSLYVKIYQPDLLSMVPSGEDEGVST